MLKIYENESFKNLLGLLLLFFTSVFVSYFSLSLTMTDVYNNYLVSSKEGFSIKTIIPTAEIFLGMIIALAVYPLIIYFIFDFTNKMQRFLSVSGIIFLGLFIGITSFALQIKNPFIYDLAIALTILTVLIVTLSKAYKTNLVKENWIFNTFYTLLLILATVLSLLLFFDIITSPSVKILLYSLLLVYLVYIYNEKVLNKTKNEETSDNIWRNNFNLITNIVFIYLAYTVIFISFLNIK